MRVPYTRRSAHGIASHAAEPVFLFNGEPQAQANLADDACSFP